MSSEAYIKTKIQNNLSSSYDLEVERVRYERLKVDINERIHDSCHVMQDEEHFVTDFVNSREMRKSFFENNIFTRTRVC